jgi:hypothetical protein
MLILFITVTFNHLATCTIPPLEPEIRHIVSSWSGHIYFYTLVRGWSKHCEHYQDLKVMTQLRHLTLCVMSRFCNLKSVLG